MEENKNDKTHEELLKDSARLDKLQSLTKGYGKGWILRNSDYNRGMRLHETTHNGATPDIREAIDNFVE